MHIAERLISNFSAVCAVHCVLTLKTFSLFVQLAANAKLTIFIIMLIGGWKFTIDGARFARYAGVGALLIDASRTATDRIILGPTLIRH